jgi:hypothetical protein
MRKHLRAAAMMVGVMAAGGAWAGDGETSQTGAARAQRAELPAEVAQRQVTAASGILGSRDTRSGIP